MTFYWTGIGSRETPEKFKPIFADIANRLQEQGGVLRSGGAPGSDQFFESGITDDAHKEIYLARKEDFKNPSPLYGVCAEALEMAKGIHPNWNAPGMVRNDGHGQLLHARNCYQVLGRNLDNPSEFLLCWTEGGEEKGGSRTAIILAKRNNVPILNFGSVRGDPMNAFDLFMMKIGRTV